MNKKNNLKEYESPRFDFVKQDESNKVFFAASGGPSSTPVTASIAKVSGSDAVTSW